MAPISWLFCLADVCVFLVSCRTAPGAVDPIAHRRLLSSDSSDSDNVAATDITADLARLRLRYSRLAAGPPVRPRDVPALVARTDDPPLAVAALSWLGGDLRPSCILALLPALFPSLLAGALRRQAPPPGPRGRAGRRGGRVPVHLRHEAGVREDQGGVRRDGGRGGVQDGARRAACRQAAVARRGGRRQGGAHAGAGQGVPQGRRERVRQGRAARREVAGARWAPLGARRGVRAYAYQCQSSRR
uniref:DOG1 domain-containing protein n=1 Tax=Aegilops tauschii subsp. strangulata TaxID=200361 RepID=A0A453KGQ1_AEGTS